VPCSCGLTRSRMTRHRGAEVVIFCARGTHISTLAPGCRGGLETLAREGV
jgi:hypothetical protein